MLVLIVARLPFALEKLMQVETVYIYGTIAVYIYCRLFVTDTFKGCTIVQS